MSDISFSVPDGDEGGRAESWSRATPSLSCASLACLSSASPTDADPAAAGDDPGGALEAAPLLSVMDVVAMELVCSDRESKLESKSMGVELNLGLRLCSSITFKSPLRASWTAASSFFSSWCDDDGDADMMGADAADAATGVLAALDDGVAQFILERL